MPSKQIKYKLQDVAKDLGIDKTELIELLDKAFPGDTQRKGQSSLTSDEVGYVLEKYTRKNEVDDVMKAFVTTKDIKTEKPAEPEKRSRKKPAVKKSDEETVVKTDKPGKTEKTENVVKNEKVEKPVKTEPVKMEKKLETDVKTEPKIEEKIEVKSEPKPEAKSETKPEVKVEPKAEQKKPQDNAPKQVKPENRDGRDNRPNRDNNRDGKGGFNRDNRENRPRDNRDNRRDNNRDNRNGSAQKPQQKPAAAKPVIDSSKIKVNTPPMQKQKGETVQRGEQVRKTVDTHGSYVELDKYNERYESIAPASKMNNDNFF